MFGDEPSIADLCLFGEITYLIGMEYPFDVEYENILKWYTEGMLSIPEFKEIHQKGFDRIQ